MLVWRAFYCSKLFKEGYDEVMYKNSCRIWLCDLISVSLNAAGPITKLATPISNGGLFGTPPGFCTDTCLWQV